MEVALRKLSLHKLCLWERNIVFIEQLKNQVLEFPADLDALWVCVIEYFGFVPKQHEGASIYMRIKSMKVLLLHLTKCKLHKFEYMNQF